MLFSAVFPPTLMSRFHSIFPNLQALASPYGTTETGVFTESVSADCIGPLIGSTVTKVINY